MSNFDAIDLDKVKSLVAEYSSIDDSTSFILGEVVDFNPLIIKNNLLLTSEAMSLLKNNFSISFDGIINIQDILDRANKDVILNGIDLAKVLSFHNHCLRIKKKIESIEDNLSIKDFGDSISAFDDLSSRIEKVVDANGNIKEDASPKLKEIFSSINRNQNNIHSAANSFLSKYSSSLQEANVFSRNDRVTFLLKNSDKNRFNGFQYGTSASGQATYVEPEQFIELNNKKASLENDKNEEVNRILREMTYLVSKYSEFYERNFDSLLRLDVIFAKAKFGFYKNGVVSFISSTNSLLLEDVAHPLIDEKSVVVNTYTLTKPYRGIVISGTNTGGKTVGLKVIGLSVLMSYLGIPVLASKSEIPLFNNVFIDIDDNQSISNALSTFSSHITNINDILNKANESSLILIDELISGTDPKEAQAISLAILEQILAINSSFVITTHYDDIKQYAFKNPYILLSSVGFNLQELKPTYKYHENSIGVSNAIDIASRFFTNQSIIEKSRNFLDLNKTKEDELLNKLSNEIAINQELKESLNKEILEQSELKKNYEDQLKKFESEKESLKNEYKKKLNDFIEDIKNEASNKLEKLEDQKSITTFIEEIEELKIDVPVEKVAYSVGDNVKVGESSQIGQISSIENDKVSVNINGMIIKTKLDNLTKITTKIKKQYKPKERMKRVSRELNLVGERVEDALVVLDNYLDSAYGSGIDSVKIIHGFGTGQLRKGIREHLKKVKFVSEFSNGDAYDGGSNVTIVKFK